MSNLSTGNVRNSTRKITGVLLVVMFFVAYWPIGPIIETGLSPFGFTLWVVIGIPAVLVAIYVFNAYQNIRADESMEEAGGER